MSWIMDGILSIFFAVSTVSSFFTTIICAYQKLNPELCTIVSRLIVEGEAIKSLHKGKIATQEGDGIEVGQGVFLKTRRVGISEPFAGVQQGR